MRGFGASWKSAFGAMAIPLAAFAAAEARDAASVAQPEMTPALNIGKMAYDAHCAACHGLNAVGTDKGPTFLHRVYHPGHHGDAAFFLAPRRGVRAHHWPFGNMPPVAGVTDAQIEKIVLYVRALQKANGIF
ncbi:MAG: cytochrome c [Rhodospirillaceae bacterium]